MRIPQTQRTLAKSHSVPSALFALAEVGQSSSRELNHTAAAAFDGSPLFKRASSTASGFSARRGQRSSPSRLRAPSPNKNGPTGPWSLLSFDRLAHRLT